MVSADDVNCNNNTLAATTNLVRWVRAQLEALQPLSPWVGRP